MGIKVQYAQVPVVLCIRLDNADGNRVITSEGYDKLIVFEIT